MSCKFLDEVFGRAATAQNPSLFVTLSVHAFDAARRGNFKPAVIAGSGPLQYTPAPAHFVERASFGGVITCSVVWQPPDASEPSAAEDVTIRVGASPHAPGSVAISLATSAGSAVPLDGSFTPSNCYSLGDTPRGSIAGFVTSFPVAMTLWLG